MTPDEREVCREGMQRKDGEEEKREADEKGQLYRMILEFAALPLEIVLRPLENDGKRGRLSLNPGDSYVAYVGIARRMTN